MLKGIENAAETIRSETTETGSEEQRVFAFLRKLCAASSPRGFQPLVPRALCFLAGQANGAGGFANYRTVV